MRFDSYFRFLMEQYSSGGGEKRFIALVDEMRAEIRVAAPSVSDKMIDSMLGLNGEEASFSIWKGMSYKKLPESEKQAIDIVFYGEDGRSGFESHNGKSSELSSLTELVRAINRVRDATDADDLAERTVRGLSDLWRYGLNDFKPELMTNSGLKAKELGIDADDVRRAFRKTMQNFGGDTATLLKAYFGGLNI